MVVHQVVSGSRCNRCIQNSWWKGFLISYQVSRVVLLVASSETIKGLARSNDFCRTRIGESELHAKGTGKALAVHLFLDEIATTVVQHGFATAETFLWGFDPFGLGDGIERTFDVCVKTLDFPTIFHGRSSRAFVFVTRDSASVLRRNTSLLICQTNRKVSVYGGYYLFFEIHFSFSFRVLTGRVSIDSVLSVRFNRRCQSRKVETLSSLSQLQ